MNKREKQERKEKLKAIIEGKRIGRLPQRIQDTTLSKIEKEKDNAKGLKKKRLETLVNVISEIQEQKFEARINQTFAEYNDGVGL